jgi:hypothetical protein
VNCKEEGWQEMLDILPWLMLQVRLSLMTFCSVNVSQLAAQSPRGGSGRLGVRSYDFSLLTYKQTPGCTQY